MKILSIILLGLVMKSALAAPSRQSDNSPVFLRYKDENGNTKIVMINSKGNEVSQTGQSSCGCSNGNSQDIQSAQSDYNDESEGSYSLEQYAVREGPNDSDDPYVKYNISEEDEEADYSGSSSNDEPSSHEISHTEVITGKKPCSPFTIESTNKTQNGARVYVYKQPKIIVKPRPTNVLIKSKPIIVRPPPIVVHHPQEKPYSPVIKYQPPKIKIRPVIVKISKPKHARTTTSTTTTTTTTTTPAPTTEKPTATRKPKCKNSKKCRKSGCDQTVYYSQETYKPRCSCGGHKYFTFET